ncbi:MAG: HNH endonuclease [Rhodospirillaceae bacterium]
MSYDHATLSAIWDKGVKIVGYDPNVWRYDAHGNPIRWSDYGNRQSKHGWEVDHIHPAGRGGSDALSNLRPLHCIANAAHIGR